jgi:hypothetical protein
VSSIPISISWPVVDDPWWKKRKKVVCHKILNLLEISFSNFVASSKKLHSKFFVSSFKA